jgi:hypothetical protein
MVIYRRTGERNPADDLHHQPGFLFYVTDKYII